MSLDALSAQRSGSRPSSEIRELLGGHLCRCTGYVPIVAAALERPRTAARGEASACLISAPAFVASVARDPRGARDRRRRHAADLRAMVRQDFRARRSASTRSGSSPAIISSPCCRTAGRRRPCTGPASSPASSSRRSTGARRQTRSTTASRTPKPSAIVYRGRLRRGRVRAQRSADALPRIARRRRPAGDDRASRTLVARERADAEPRADADAWSLMLYTSGTTASPKGVPRRQRAERAAAVAHVAQNLYRAWRAHARRHAALPHDGRALAAGDVADRRRFRLPAALRCRRRAAS